MERHAPDWSAEHAQSPIDIGFSPSSSPVALKLVADSVLASTASIVRLTDRLAAIAATARHLSIAVTGTITARQRLSDCLLDALAGAAATLVVRTEPLVASDVLPRCPLLAPEPGSCEWSELRLLVPPDTAWLLFRLKLTDYLTESGVIDRSLLSAAADDIVDTAEECFDGARWPTPGMQQDAWMNRRLAVSVTGYAVLYERCAYSLSALHQITGWLSARLQARSRWHAAHRRPLPAILGADPARGMPPGGLRDEWSRRWQAAVTATAVRHRNLLAIEVDALVYRDEQVGRLNLELLPLITHADVTALASSLDMDHGERGALDRRLRAALQQRHALDQIAKHI